MPLLYRDGVWRLDGVPVNQDGIAEYRDALADREADALGALALTGLARDPDEDGPWEEAVVAAFLLAFMRRVSDGVTAAYVVARGGVVAVPPAEWRVVVDLVARQQGYADGFAAALRGGTISHAQAVARARLYAGATVDAFERAKAKQSGFDAPAYPGEGCRGGSQCRCYWSIVEFPDRYEAIWRAVGDTNTCDVCRQRARDWAPYVQQKAPAA